MCSYRYMNIRFIRKKTEILVWISVRLVELNNEELKYFYNFTKT